MVEILGGVKSRKTCSFSYLFFCSNTLIYAYSIGLSYFGCVVFYVGKNMFMHSYIVVLGQLELQLSNHLS